MECDCTDVVGSNMSRIVQLPQGFHVHGMLRCVPSAPMHANFVEFWNAGHCHISLLHVFMSKQGSVVNSLPSHVIHGPCGEHSVKLSVSAIVLHRLC